MINQNKWQKKGWACKITYTKHSWPVILINLFHELEWEARHTHTHTHKNSLKNKWLVTMCFLELNIYVKRRWSELQFSNHSCRRPQFPELIKNKLFFYFGEWKRMPGATRVQSCSSVYVRLSSWCLITWHRSGRCLSTSSGDPTELGVGDCYPDQITPSNVQLGHILTSCGL